MYVCATAFSSELNINKYLVLLGRTAPVSPTSNPGSNKDRKDIHMVSDSIW